MLLLLLLYCFLNKQERETNKKLKDEINDNHVRIESLERQLKEKQDKDLQNSKNKAQTRKNEETRTEFTHDSLEQLNKVALLEERLRSMNIELQEMILKKKEIDVEIQEKQMQLTTNEQQLQQMDMKINQKEDLLKGKVELLLVKNENLEATDRLLKTKDEQLKEKIVQLAEKENQLVELKRVLSEKQAQQEGEISNQAEATSKNENPEVRCKHYCKRIKVCCCYWKTLVSFQ